MTIGKLNADEFCLGLNDKIRLENQQKSNSSEQDDETGKEKEEEEDNEFVSRMIRADESLFSATHSLYRSKINSTISPVSNKKNNNNKGRKHRV